MYRLLFFILLASCGKEECRQCFNVVETNEHQAALKCLGVANKYPKLDYAEDFAGTLCGSEIDNFTDGGRKQVSMSYLECVEIKWIRYKVCR
jgi:hypothetical protein